MKHKFWRWAWLPTTILAMLSMIGLLYIGLKDPNVGKVDSSQQLRYVLVNQDEGASFNQTNYQLGRDFVNLINQDKTNQWQTASADIAEAGFSQGNYDAIITIRPDLSRKLLSLQAASPEKADISYQVRPDQNRISATQLASQVNALMFTFNKKVVSMYFSSVLSNLLNAQQNATNIVNGDSVNLTTWNQQVKSPLSPTAEGFKSVLDNNTAMLQQTDSWEQQQANFTKLTTALLNSNAKQLQDNALTLSDYIAFQEKISKLNYANAKADIQTQAKNDEKAYQAQFDALNETMAAQMQSLGGNNGASALLGQLHQVGERFAQNQTQIQNSIKNQIDQAETTQQAIGDQRRAIIEQYTGDADFDVDKASEEHLNLALATTLAKKMKLAEENFPMSYFDPIKQDIQTIPVLSLKRLLMQFKTQQLLDDSTYKNYMNQLVIVQKEADDQKIDLKDQNLIGDQSNASGKTDYDSILKLTITDAESGKISFKPVKNGSSVKLTNAQALLDQVNQVILAKQLNLTAKLTGDLAIVLTPKAIPSESAVSSASAPKEENSTKTEASSVTPVESSDDKASPSIQRRHLHRHHLLPPPRRRHRLNQPSKPKSVCTPK
ncbi:type VII secretion protein EsaA [Lacticaseibacillus paracasei]|uniref:type VII secretion protein EsaA n=1 Tax=Lacticaseibacillus paracasei TaxID=1597 RepID=UPI002B226A7D|nr:type VII secretion protein EsaA [Lacticaseibacillus paracasei]MEB0328686.1 type VII secretion protein EsaA [Lacticaseibacillus paracasei]